MNDFRKHEILDRIGCIQLMIHEILPDDSHDDWARLPVALKSKLAALETAAYEAYQAAGDWRFKEEP